MRYRICRRRNLNCVYVLLVKKETSAHGALFPSKELCNYSATDLFAFLCSSLVPVVLFMYHLWLWKWSPLLSPRFFSLPKHLLCLFLKPQLIEHSQKRKEKHTLPLCTFPADHQAAASSSEHIVFSIDLPSERPQRASQDGMCD